MAGSLTISTLKDSSGVLATQNGMTGIAKAWLAYNGVTQTIIGSFNVSSVTYNATGDYTANFTTAMPNANYSVATSCQTDNTGDTRYIVTLKYNNRTTSAVGFFSTSTLNAKVNTEYVGVSVFSS